MKLEKNRQFEYNLNKIADNHPRLDYYELTYTAVDNSKIYAEVMVPKGCSSFITCSRTSRAK